MSDSPEIPQTLLPLRERLDEIFGSADAARITSTMAQPKRTAYWCNPLVTGQRTVPGEPVEGVAECFSVPPERRAELLGSAGVIGGAVYPLNPSSVIAVRAMKVRAAAEGVRGATDGNLDAVEVLDLAAAPGGKTLLIAAEMKNLGRIAAVESVRGRFHRMRANLARCGVSNTAFYLADGRSIGRKVPQRFHRVLLDAPCSSEARIRFAEPVSFRHWKLRKIKECARKQRALLRSAYAALRSGGSMIYCTCSFAPEENELIVDYLLGREPTARILEVDCASAVTREGLCEWRHKKLDPQLSRARRILPDELWDGFFICRIQKVS